jgi:hypothetical protein
MPFEALARKGIQFRRGGVVLVAAGPGTGKSAFMLTYALRAGVPTMYFSADSDASVQQSRALSVLNGWPLSDSLKVVLDDDVQRMSALAGSPVRFETSASPSLNDIELSMASYNEVYGAYPWLAIVDNVTNVRTESSVEDDPFSGLESLMDYLSTMARNTGCCVVGLHHVLGPYNDSAKPIPLSGVKGQITRVPAMVLTLHKLPALFAGGPDTLCVSAVKNRGGKPDPTGQDFAQLMFQGETLTIKDL